MVLGGVCEGRIKDCDHMRWGFTAPLLKESSRQGVCCVCAYSHRPLEDWPLAKLNTETVAIDAIEADYHGKPFKQCLHLEGQCLQELAAQVEMLRLFSTLRIEGSSAQLQYLQKFYFFFFDFCIILSVDILELI